jgi:hypothetical protein
MHDITDSDKKLRWARRLGVVPRWTIVPTINKQHVDAHSFQVVVLADWLCTMHGTTHHSVKRHREFRSQVMEWAVYHDLEEAATGDAPTPSKPPPTLPKELSQVQLTVKLADVLEALLFIHEERLFGNCRVTEIWDELLTRFSGYWGLFHKRERVEHDPDKFVDHLLGIMEVHPGIEARIDQR